jgi:two-component system chemotaxis sensor kinase CheA
MKKVTPGNVFGSVTGVFYRLFIGKRFSFYKDTPFSSQYLFMNFLFLIAVLFFFGAGLVVINTNYRMGQMSFGLAGFTFLSIVLLRLKISIKIPGFVFIIPFGIFCAYLTRLALFNGLGAVWSLTFPIVAIFVLGIRYGLYIDMAMGAVLATIIFTPEISNYRYHASGAGIFFVVYIILALITIISELIRLDKEAEVTQLTSDLKQERDELNTMKDNLNIGVFMINQSFIIQPYYTQALEDILSHSNLTGLSIIDVFVDSINNKQRNILKDYFSMMFNMTHDVKLLEEINPIQEIEYTSAETRAKRTLNCRFSVIQRQEETLLLGAIYDITEQTKMERELKAESNKRQAEMKTLFEIVQVDPAVFDEFIEDTDYQFDRLNTILKRNDVPLPEVIVNFYQSIHAIKSNAAILGLDGFAEICHALEDEIKVVQNKKEMQVTDLFHLTFELEKVFVERDKLEKTLDRIASFRKQSAVEPVFVVSVRKAVAKVAEETEKLAVLKVDHLDEDVVKSELRNVIKEVVLQLARNAVFHGLEDPETREALHKPATGTVTLSIKNVGGTIEILFSDDGKGLDLNRIKEKAVEAGLIPADASNSQILSAMFMPGLSTSKEETMSAGRGIGMSLVAERMKEINGKLSVSTKEGAGTVFTLRIPYKNGKVEQAEPEPVLQNETVVEM